MFLFFKTRKWLLWSWLGTLAILSSLWVQVQIDVKINEWFGEFYDMIQKALGSPNAITIGEYWASLLSFITLAGIYVGVAVILLHIIYLDGVLQWLNGTTVFMTRQEPLKVQVNVYRKILLSLPG